MIEANELRFPKPVEVFYMQGVAFTLPAKFLFHHKASAEQSDISKRWLMWIARRPEIGGFSLPDPVKPWYLN